MGRYSPLRRRYSSNYVRIALPLYDNRSIRAISQNFYFSIRNLLILTRL